METTGKEAALFIDPTKRARLILTCSFIRDTVNNMADRLTPGRAEMHEAGHAVAASLYGIPYSVVTVSDAEQSNAMRIGGHVRVEDPLFCGDGETHISTPLPDYSDVQLWDRGIFLLSGLAAEIAANDSDPLPVHPKLLRYSAENDLQLIRELFVAADHRLSGWERLIDDTLNFVYKHWRIVSAVADLLIKGQNVYPDQIKQFFDEFKGHDQRPGRKYQSTQKAVQQTVEFFENIQGSGT